MWKHVAGLKWEPNKSKTKKKNSSLKWTSWLHVLWRTFQTKRQRKNSRGITVDNELQTVQKKIEAGSFDLIALTGRAQTSNSVSKDENRLK